MQEVVDFKGIKYKSINQMCEAYNIDPCTFNERLRRGYNLEKALTAPIVSPKKSIVDFEGNGFDSIVDIELVESKLRVTFQLLQILHTAVRQVIYGHYLMAIVHQSFADMTAYKTGSSGN